MDFLLRFESLAKLITINTAKVTVYSFVACANKYWKSMCEKLTINLALLKWIN